VILLVLTFAITMAITLFQQRGIDRA
jgi:hypothetical protein